MTLPMLEVRPLGIMPFADAYTLQRDLCLARAEGRLAHDVLLLVQHPSVYTFGRGTKAASLPLSAEALAADGSDVVDIERGGDVTWHTPGQLIGYPILHLSALREDLHWYLRELEQALIEACATVGVRAERNPGYTGVWTEGRKLASIGIHVKRWVTMHGFALNVVNDLAGFARIVPCGIAGVAMTSLLHERGGDPVALWQTTHDAVADAIAVRFGHRRVDAPLEGTL